MNPVPPALLLCWCAPAALAQQYTVHQLALPAGAVDTVVTAIGEDGRIVGSATRPPLGRVAVLWPSFDAEPVVLGTLDGGDSSEAIAITGGQVVGVSARACGQPGAFLWTEAGGMSALGPAGCTTIQTVGINGRGEVLLQAGTPQYPLVWPLGAGTPRLLETWDQPATVLRIDEAGRVLGSSRHHPAGGGVERAIEWSAAGEPRLLGRLDPDAGGVDAAFDRNAAGQIVGFARLGTVSRAAVWNAAGQATDAGAALGPGVASQLIAINSSGQAVGGSARGAILWTASGGAVPLEAMVDESGVGWRLMLAHGINDAGLIVGNGMNPSGRPRAFVLTQRGAGCPADLDGDGSLTIFDFLSFQNLFDSGDPRADFDGDGSLTIFDFLAFQNAFDAGCP